MRKKNTASTEEGKRLRRRVGAPAQGSEESYGTTIRTKTQPHKKAEVPKDASAARSPKAK